MWLWLPPHIATSLMCLSQQQYYQQQKQQQATFSVWLCHCRQDASKATLLCLWRQCSTCKSNNSNSRQSTKNSSQSSSAAQRPRRVDIGDVSAVVVVIGTCQSLFLFGFFVVGGRKRGRRGAQYDVSSSRLTCDRQRKADNVGHGHEKRRVTVSTARQVAYSQLHNLPSTLLAYVKKLVILAQAVVARGSCAKPLKFWVS